MSIVERNCCETSRVSRLVEQYVLARRAKRTLHLYSERQAWTARHYVMASNRFGFCETPAMMRFLYQYNLYFARCLIKGGDVNHTA
jgi:hypothetical protein